MEGKEEKEGGEKKGEEEGEGEHAHASARRLEEAGDSLASVERVGLRVGRACLLKGLGTQLSGQALDHNSGFLHSLGQESSTTSSHTTVPQMEAGPCSQAPGVLETPHCHRPPHWSTCQDSMALKVCEVQGPLPHTCQMRERWGLSWMTIFWPLFSQAALPPPLSPQLLRLGQQEKKSLAWLLGCQQSNISRGLAWFQVLPGAFPRSGVELSARISWLWVSPKACPPACLRAQGLCFICSCPIPALGASLSGFPASLALMHGQQRRSCEWLSWHVRGSCF